MLLFFLLYSGHFNTSVCATSFSVVNGKSPAQFKMTLASCSVSGCCLASKFNHSGSTVGSGVVSNVGSIVGSGGDTVVMGGMTALSWGG